MCSSRSHFLWSHKKDDKIRYVIRKPLDSLEKEDIEKIVDDVVRAKIQEAIIQKGFKEAMSETIWMNETLQIPIKKVRIYIKDNPIQLKPHRDKSQYEYKRFVNVKNDSNYCLAIYEGTNDRGKTVRSYSAVNNLDAAKFYNGKTFKDSIVPFSDDNDMPLKCILKIGTMILFYEKSPKELYECTVEELSKRLYKIVGLSSGSEEYPYAKISCRHHLEARKAKDIKAKNGVWKIGEDYRPVIKILHTQIKAFVEGQDFELTLDGQIKFKNYYVEKNTGIF